MHYAEVNVRRPGWPEHTRLHKGAGPGRLRCELEVLRCVHVRLGRGAAAAGWREEAGWEAVVELRSGRTHQARPARLSACRAQLDAGVLLRVACAVTCLRSAAELRKPVRAPLQKVHHAGLAAWMFSPSGTLRVGVSNG